MTADYTYTHPQLNQGTTLKFKTSADWSTGDTGFCVNRNGVKDQNISFNSTDRSLMATVNTGCNRYGRETFLSMLQFELIKDCDGGKSLAYNDKCFWDISISGTTMTATTRRQGEEVTVKFKKIK